MNCIVRGLYDKTNRQLFLSAMLSSNRLIQIILLSLFVCLPSLAWASDRPANLKIDNLLYLEGLRLGLDHSAEVIAATGNSLRAMAHHGLEEAHSSEIDRSNPVFRQHVAAAARRYWVNRAPKLKATQQQLKGLYLETQSDYVIPERLSFSHHYFRKPQQWQTIISLANAGETVPSVAHPLGQRFVEITKMDIEKRFGEQFADALLELPNEKQWHGPVASTLGFHLLRISDKQPAGQPAFNRIKPTLTARWQRQQQERWLESKFAEIQRRIQAQ